MFLIQRLSGGQLLFLLISVTATAGMVVALLLTNSLPAQLFVSLLLATLLVLGSRVALPPSAFRMRTIRYAIWTFSGLFVFSAGLQPYIDQIVLHYFSAYLSTEWLNNILADTKPTILILILVVIMYTFTLFSLRESPPLGPSNFDPNIRVSEYRDLRKAFVDILKFELERVDEDLRWNHRDFVPLNAEIDIRNANKSRKRVVDMIEAIKRNQQADIFVVVGVPGSGKSVALRKCCRDLLHTQGINERIPIYVNLKEWMWPENWSSTAEPNDKDFAIFVRRNIRNRLPNNMLRFFDKHFDRMVSAGEIFFIFDSFDEIPGILDVDESSNLLGQVSAVIIRYLRGSPRSRGIVASRYYRRPRLGREVHVQLEVRPFSERQIARVVSKSPRSSDLLRIMFRERLELGSLARNPFSLSLLIAYWEDNNWKAPPNQAALYRSYIDESLRNAEEQFGEIGLTSEDIREAMGAISWEMFKSSGRGLEMTVRELRDALDNPNVDEVVDALVAARLARKASRTQAVSFVHRRFNEYFIASRWLSGENRAPLEAIPNDWRSRDALVLYAEVADQKEATRIANFCWTEINGGLNHETEVSAIPLPVIYCLRFLNEAFRTQSPALSDFRNELGRRIVSIVRNNDDIVLRKISVESVGLLPPKYAEETLAISLESGNSWIAETAISACRYLTELPSQIEERLFNAIRGRTPVHVILPDRDLLFALSLSDAFNRLRRKIRASQLDWSIAFLSGVSLAFFSIIFGNYIGILIVLLFTFMYTLNGVSLPYIAINIEKLPRMISSKMLNTYPIMAPVNFSIGQNFKITTFINAVILAVCSLPMFYMVFLFVVPVVGKFATGDDVYSSDVELIPAQLILISPVFVVALLNIGTIVNIAMSKKINTWHIYLLRWLYKLPSKKIFVIFLIATSIIIISLIILYLTYILRKHYEQYFLFLIFLFISIPAIFMFNISRKNMYLLRNDYKNFNKLTARFIPSRARIAEGFSDFKTAKYRRRYVEWVDRQSNDPDHLLKLSKENWHLNSWPNGFRPNVGDDEASTLLAQLDGRWLGLDI